MPLSIASRHQAVYPIGVAKNLTGLSQRQIRYYEEAGLLQPLRTAGNQRLYSPADIELLLRIKMLVGRGLTLEEVGRVLAHRADQDGGLLWHLRRDGPPLLRRQPVPGLRDVPPMRVLAHYYRQRPPAIDRLYRGGMAGTFVPLPTGIRLYPLHDPAALGLIQRRQGAEHQ